MRITDLQYYLALANYRNFSQVSDKFGVSQPTISLAMKRLEKEVGAKLIIRQPAHKNVGLTHSGEVLHQHASLIVEQYELALTEIKRNSEQSLLIGLPPIIQISYFPAIANVLSDESLAHLKTVEVGAQEAIDQLKNGEIDASFVGYLDDIDQSEFNLIPFDEQPFAILAADDYPLAQKGSVSFNELKDEKFILLKGNFVHNYAFDLLARSAHVQANVLFNSSEPYGILSLIRQNRGIGFMAAHPALTFPGVTAIPITDKNQPIFKVGFAYRKDLVLTPDQQKIFDELLAASQMGRPDHLIPPMEG
ncbi:LysR family transcriptional regulator [Fructobacillus ficulneus]|uniref:Malolactic fermentation system transcription activator n=1 Tax=Fructobacillus ficulneus TaxID=157463 RepID=A0A0K8MG43_9LACO|nr:LysR family transcriptional regulator [Fructobacillus ficulneus]GAO99470.1 malolactic fermentation system transcription activator [Fructobacillus ficulneus]